MNSGVPRQIKDWKSHISNFLHRRPELVMSNTRGYFRLLEEMELIDSATADKLCQMDARALIVRPETFVRVRRELIESGNIHVPQAQRHLLEDSEEEVRGYYSRH